MLVARHKIVTVAAAGTAQKLFAATESLSGVMSILIQGHTGTCYLGGSTVSATDYGLKVVSTSVPIAIPVNGQSMDLRSIYIDAGANSDKVTLLYFEKV